MKKILISTAVLTFLLLLGYTQIRDEKVWTVINNSSTDIYVEFKHDVYAEIHIDTIASGEKSNIFYKDGVIDGENIESPTQFITMFISNDQDSLSKDENNEENWLVESRKIRKNREERHFDFTFSVSDNDF